MACTKIAYDTYKQAQSAITYAKRTGNGRHPKAKLPQRAYKCNRCGKWHTTSRKAKKSKKVWR